MLKWFRDLHIGAKLRVLIALALVALVASALQSLTVFRRALLEDRKAKTRHVVESVYGVIEHFGREAEAGRMTDEEAKRSVLAILRPLRYDGQEYFWLNDAHPRMVMHPFKPELEGKDLTDNQDPAGKHLFVEFVQVCREHGSGFVDYLWPKPGMADPVPKVSFVKAYRRWGWIVGSGIYLDDVHAAFMTEVKRLAAATALIALLLALSAAAVVRSITRPLATALTVANRLAEGDVTVRIDVAGQDETGQLCGALQHMLERLQEIIGAVRTSADALSSTSEELTEIARSLSVSSGAQAAGVEESSASLQEITGSIHRNTNDAQLTDRVAGEAATQAREGGAAVKETVEAMRRIAEQIAIVDEIAYRTNLLALNSAIEAARAGVHGRGFAVVAAEVRQLAERSRSAAAQISEVARGSVRTAERAGELLDGIVPAIEETAKLVRRISGASAEQADGVGMINSAMSQLNHATQEHASASDGLTASAEAMSARAEELRRLVAFFRLTGDSDAPRAVPALRPGLRPAREDDPPARAANG